jgi:hypothetical protein
MSNFGIVRALINRGSSLRDVEKEVFLTASMKQAAETLLVYLEHKRAWKPKVIWLYGPQSPNKVARLEEIYVSHEDIYVHSGNASFPGYDAHKVVLFDGLLSSTFTYAYFTQLLDRYPCRVQISTAKPSRQFLATQIYVVTTQHPETFLPAGENSEHLLRRVDEIISI